MTTNWEPAYGFCAYNETGVVALARTLEAIRRQVCAYGGGNRCDCKYGLTVDEDAVLKEFGVASHNGEVNRFQYTGVVANPEQTGCPELRELIHRLLHRDQPLI